jgi:mRNA interferase MazF
VWLADLEPTRGSEANTTRPVVVVSNDHGNMAAEANHRGVVTVVPLTSATQRVYAFQVLLEPRESGLLTLSKAQPEHLRAIDISRFERRLGRVEPSRLWELDEAIALHLGLN